MWVMPKYIGPAFNNQYTPVDIADMLSPAMMSCELELDYQMTGETDWRGWLINSIDVISKNKAIDFLLWCFSPMYKIANGQKPLTRLQSTYKGFVIIDKNGNSVIGADTYLKIDEVYDYWLNQIKQTDSDKAENVI